MSEVDQTGQAFYDRFNEELSRMSFGKTKEQEDFLKHHLRLAAKRAAGIEHNATDSDATTDTASLPSGGSQNSIDSILRNFRTAILMTDDSLAEIEAKAALLNWHTQTAYQELLELIGETEVAPHKPDDLPQEQYMDFKSNMWARNDLRKELRTAAKAKYGQEE